ncbi:VCBS domain-containing protein, partial [Pseudovibrio axinellae]
MSSKAPIEKLSLLIKAANAQTAPEEIFGWVSISAEPLTPEATEAQHKTSEEALHGSSIPPHRELIFSGEGLGKLLGTSPSEVSNMSASAQDREGTATGVPISGLHPIHTGTGSDGSTLATTAASHYLLPNLGNGNLAGASSFHAGHLTGGVGGSSGGGGGGAGSGGSGNKQTGNVVSAGQNGTPAVAALTAQGKEDKDLPLHIRTVDSHGNGESIRLVITGIPKGAHLNLGHTDQQGHWLIDPGTDISHLKMTPPPDWSGQGYLTVIAVQPDGKSSQALLPYQIASTPDGALISGRDQGSAIEDRLVDVTGELNIVDPDPGEAAFKPDRLTGSYGSLKIDSSGHWTYSLNNGLPQVQSLKEGSRGYETFQVHSVDGTSHQILIGIQGTQDQAVISGLSIGTVTEETALTTSGQLSIVDP